MAYCKIGDPNATVTWQYQNDDPKRFISNIVPIDVTIGFDDEVGVWRVDTYDDMTISYIASYSGTQAESPVGIARELRTASTNRLISSDGNIAAGNVRVRSAVFTPNSQRIYRIKVLDTTGKVIFENFKETNTPPKYQVACGVACPEGFCKCEIPEYPGYCCLDCAFTAASIHAITNELKYKNLGGLPPLTLT
ncbi:MAG: hypothetical protein V7K32_00315 [Nostoc sp.]|uniref:hypothetical protein n=1 Tax=Nostoc sp. TaxID=1180 RepID=UPI002FF6F76B